MRWQRIVLGGLATMGFGALSCSHAAPTQPSEQGTPEWEAEQRRQVTSAATKPNIVVLMLDDVGFGHLSSFGGPVPTPNIDRVAQRGLRYTNFHTTALCSPSRAAFLTGRNHHSVGTGKITEFVSEEAGYTGRIPKDAATIAQILQQNGYATYALGKWHNTPVDEVTLEGPYDLWPQTLGFDHFYGFMAGETNQWAPNIWDDKKPIDPAVGNDDYLLDTDLGDHAVAFIEKAKTDEPFFLYLAPGTAHAPHHAPREYIDRNKGRFDKGWDAQRDETLARQKEMGIMPKDAGLPPRPDVIRAWDGLSKDEKRLYSRMQEVFAGALEYADAQFGRVLDALERTGRMDNTILVVTSDNGASAEGALEGAANDIRVWNYLPEDFSENLRAIDELGGPKTFNHYPAGWALAGNTPGQYWKQTVHEGGVRDPFVIAYPKRIADEGGIRTQFTHIIDVLPTLLDVAGLPLPTEVRGLKQMPFEGKSFAATLEDAKAPPTKVKQYFEMFGNRAIWSNGMKAVAFHGRWPWDTRGSNPNFDEDPWELYDLDADPNETRDLSEAMPDKLSELQALFEEEAKKHNVFPMNDSTSALAAATAERLTGGKERFVYTGVTRAVPEWLSPPVKDHSHSIIATVNVPEGGAEGVLATCGGRFAGYALYVKDGRLVYTHNYLGTKYTITSDKEIAPGDHELKLAFERTGPNKGKGHLFIDGKPAGDGEIAHTVPVIYSASEWFNTGMDTATAAGDYPVPFAFSGKLDKVVVTIDDLGERKNERGND